MQQAVDASLVIELTMRCWSGSMREKPEAEKCYSPAECIGCWNQSLIDIPDPPMITVSHVERQNLTIRMQTPRLTRLTSAFSKKWDNLWAAYRLHLAYYRFCCVHKTMRVTPVMGTGITDHVWLIADLLL
jgi:hypothetical protein